MATQQLMRLTAVPEPALSLRARLQLAWRSFTMGGALSSNSPELAKLFNGGTSSTGIAVDELSALTYSAVWAAVTLISDDIASLPLMLYKRLKTGGKDRFEDHPLYRLLHDAPNPELSTMQWRRTMQSHALLWGNGYSEIERDNANRPVAIWPLTPDRVTPFRATSRSPLQYRVTNQTSATVIDAANMLVLPGLSYEGNVGYRVIDKMKESLGLSLAAERYGSYAYANGLSFGGVITYEGNPADEVKKNNREVLERRHAGVENARKFLALYGGAKFEATSTSPHDAQFQELRTFQIREVARWFKVPPHKLADLADATFSNVEQQNIDYYTSCLRPWLELWEQELGRKLIAAQEQRIQFVEHIADGLLRADAAGRGEMYSKRFSVASMTPNEIRNAENADPLPGGDRAFVQLSMIPLDRVDEYIDSLIKKNDQPPPAPGGPAPDPAKVRALEEELRAALTRAELAEVEGRKTLELAETLNGVKTAQAARLEASVPAVRAVLVTSVHHVLLREADRARKAQGSPQKFAKWLETFYALHADVVRAALRPALKAWLAVAGDPTPIEALLDRAVQAHIWDSERQLRAVLEEATAEGLGVPLERVLRRWELERAEATVERWTRRD